MSIGMTRQEQDRYNKTFLALIPIGFILGIFLTLVSGAAQSNQDSFVQCLNDNTTLNISIVSERCIKNQCETFSNWRTQFCEFGCSSDIGSQCNPAPFTTEIIFGVIFGIMILIFVAFAKKFGLI